MLDVNFSQNPRLKMQTLVSSAVHAHAKRLLRQRFVARTDNISDSDFVLDMAVSQPTRILTAPLSSTHHVMSPPHASLRGRAGTSRGRSSGASTTASCTGLT